MLDGLILTMQKALKTSKLETIFRKTISNITIIIIDVKSIKKGVGDFLF